MVSMSQVKAALKVNYNPMTETKINMGRCILNNSRRDYCSKSCPMLSSPCESYGLLVPFMQLSKKKSEELLK